MATNMKITFLRIPQIGSHTTGLANEKAATWCLQFLSLLLKRASSSLSYSHLCLNWKTGAVWSRWYSKEEQTLSPGLWNPLPWSICTQIFIEVGEIKCVFPLVTHSLTNQHIIFNMFERKCSHLISWFTTQPQTPSMTDWTEAKTKNQELYAGLPYGCQGPKLCKSWPASSQGLH